MQLEAHVHKSDPGMSGDHVCDFAHGVLHVLHDVLDGVPEHVADDVHGGVLVERDAKCPFFVPGDADQGGNTAAGDFVLFHVGWSGHDFKVRCGG